MQYQGTFVSIKSFLQPVLNLIPSPWLVSLILSSGAELGADAFAGPPMRRGQRVINNLPENVPSKLGYIEMTVTLNKKVTALQSLPCCPTLTVYFLANFE